MQFNDIRVSTKLWSGILGLLLVSLAAGAWSQYRATEVADTALASVRAAEQRISDAIDWRGATETVGERVVASNITAEPPLTTVLDQRISAGVARIGVIQKRIVASATSDAEKAALARAGEERNAVLALNKRARELKLESSTGAVSPDFIEKTYVPAIGRYIESLDAFVKLQEQQRDQAIVALESARHDAMVVSVICMLVVLLAGVALAAVLVKNMSDPLAHAVAVAESIATGDLTVQPRTDRRDEFGQLLSSLAAMVHKLRGVVGEVRSGVESVSTASSEIALGNQDLSGRTEQTASSLQQTAASMEQLTGTVSQSTDTAHRARQLAGMAAQEATRGGEVMSEVVSSMSQISGSSRRIGDIIGTIDSIAFQTNILALNAAVEAARAGEQGRGFAVVASEVRSLAQRSAQAAREIKTLIGASVDTVDAGSRQVAQAGETMGAIVNSVRQVADLIAEIHAASSEQRDGIGQVNQAVSQLDQMTQQNAALVEQSAAAASSLRDQAQRLSLAISVFRLDVGHRVHTPAPAPLPAAVRALKPAAPQAIRAPAKPPAAPGRSAVPTLNEKVAAGDDDWSSF